MKHLQEFKNKVQEWNKLKDRKRQLDIQLTKEIEEFQITLVGILDEFKKNNIKIDVKVKDNLFFNIRHKKNEEDKNFHSKGSETTVFWKLGSQQASDLLWNFNAGGVKKYEEIVAILEFLIQKYPKEYESYLMKLQANKYNL